jgi:hypothetical protein
VAKYFKEDDGNSKSTGSFKGIVVGLRTTIAKTGGQKTVILKNIMSLDGKIIHDHLCCNLTRSLERLDLQEGDVVRFDAIATAYSKRCKYEWEELEYKFNKLRKMEKSE